MGHILGLHVGADDVGSDDVSDEGDGTIKLADVDAFGSFPAVTQYRWPSIKVGSSEKE